MSAEVPWLVLDTNAWLDLLVFDDSGLIGLAAEIEDGHVRVAIDRRAMDELARILASEKLALDPSKAEACLQRACSLTTLVDVSAPPLPRCRDPDDQMFLEIAAAMRATWLVTRDAELLRLSRRMMRDHAVSILTPVDWQRSYRP